MISTAAGIDSLMLNLTQEIQVHATLEATFAALLEQLGPANDTPDGRPMPMKIEPGREAGGSATWATGTATSGVLCRPSSARRSWKSRVHCLCPIRLFRMCNTD